MRLSESQKKYLRGLGHQLKPLIIVGDVVRLHADLTWFGEAGS